MGFREWKAANCNHNYNNAYYFDEENFFHRINGYESFAQTDMALEFIDRNSGDKPWALYLSWGPPHTPYDTAPEPYKSLFLNKSPALRKNVPETILQNLKKNQWLSRDDIIEMLRGYYAHIAALDECFGRLIENLKKNKQIENTIVVYTSDHGDMLGSQGICKKQAPYFESVNVPCMISWPGRIIPGVSDEVFGLVDLPVTLLGITGLSFSEKRDGADLSKLLLHGVPPENHSTYISICIPAHQRIDLGRTEWYGVKTKKWTYAKNYSGEFEILFNDKKDPYQLKNLANDQSFKDVSNTLQQELAMHIECAGDKLLPWREYLKLFKYEKVWNSSQAYMNRPEEEYI
jgi:arylsulfatase A-like enzyme